MNSIAIIGSGEMAVVIVENAKKMNLETHCFSNDPTDKVVGVCDFFHDISIFDIDSIINTCLSVGVIGVLSTTELTIPIAAKVASRLNLPNMDVILSESITDKSFVRSKAKRVKRIKQPEFLVIDKNNLSPCINRYPVIVKPTSMGGKRGVKVVYSDNELKDAIQYAADSMPANKRDIIIEEYIQGGKEYSVESLSCNGKHYVIQITEKISSGPPHCVELGHLQPANIKPDMIMKVELAVKELLECIGIDNSASHTEIKVLNGNIYLIELNARLGGDHIAYPLTELSTGYKYIQELVNVAIGRFTPPEKSKFLQNSCGVIFISEQTKRFLNLFKECEKYSWLYKKNVSSESLIEITINHSFDTNYMIFLSSNRKIPKEIKELL